MKVRGLSDAASEGLSRESLAHYRATAAILQAFAVLRDADEFRSQFSKDVWGRQISHRDHRVGANWETHHKFSLASPQNRAHTVGK